MFLKSELVTNAESLTDLLLYDGLLGSDVLHQQDGSLQASWKYRGKDTTTWDTQSLRALSHSVAGALNLGNGWMVETNAMRRPVYYYPPTLVDCHPVARVIDEERRLQFTGGQCFDTETFITLTYLPPSLTSERAARWASGEKKQEADNLSERERLGEKTFRLFLDTCDSFESTMRAHVDMERLTAKADDQQYLRFLRECIHGDDFRFAVPDISTELNLLLGADLITGEQLIIDRRPVRVIAIDAFPSNSEAGMWRALAEMPFRYRWHTRTILLDAAASEKMHDRHRKHWRSQQRPFYANFISIRLPPKANKDPNLMETDAENAMTTASRGLVQFGSYNVKLILYGEQIEPDVLAAVRKGVRGQAIRPYMEQMDALRENTKIAAELIKASGFNLRVETRNAMDALRGSWPGHGYSDVRLFPVHTRNYSDGMPLSTPYTGEEFNPSQYMPKRTPPLMLALTAGGTLLKYHQQNRDVGHGLLIGPTRSGKSAKLALMAAQWLARYPNGRVIAFDKKASMRMLCEAMDGIYYPLGGPQRFAPRLSPLQDLEDQSHMTWCEWYIAHLFALGGRTLAPSERNLISETLRRLKDRPSHLRTLTHFQTMLGNQNLGAALQYFTSGSEGSMGMLDGATNELHFDCTPFVVFEMEYLFAMDAKVRQAVIPYLLEVIARQLSTDTPTLLEIDEAWLALLDKSMEEALRSFLKESAKMGCSIVLATQNLDDFFDSPLRNIIIDNCMTRTFLPNPSANTHVGLKRYGEMGLTVEQCEAIANGVAQKDYFVQRTGDDEHATFRKLRLELGKVALSFFGANSAEEQRTFHRFRDEDPIYGAVKWLQTRGLTDWADYLKTKIDADRKGMEAVA